MLNPAEAARQAWPGRLRGRNRHRHWERHRERDSDRERNRARAAWRVRFQGRVARGRPEDGAGAALLVPLAFQIAVPPAAALIYVGGDGAASNRAVLTVSAMLTAGTALLYFALVRGFPPRTVLLADTALAVAGNVAMSAFSSPSARAAEVSWQYCAGCVALWTLARGVPSGLATAAAGIPVRLAMFAVAGPVHSPRSAAVVMLGDTAVLATAVLVAAALLLAADRDADRVRTIIRRSLHDTVLQTLEAIALTLPDDAEQAQRRLREVRAVAHAEAVALRRRLSRPAFAAGPPDLVEGLVALVAELAREGLRVRLDAAGAEPGGVTAERRAALLAAVREALRNVLKHAGVTEALIRVEGGAGDGAPQPGAAPAGLTVLVRDFGVGFDPAAHRPGFGLSQSIAARMAEAGGTAGVRAQPGQGTSVTLWVPLEGYPAGCRRDLSPREDPF